MNTQRKLGKTLGDRTYSWYRRLKSDAKVKNRRLVRRRLNRMSKMEQ